MTSRTRARALVPALIAVAIGAAPSGARAATSTYNVTVKTTVDYKLHRSWGNAKNGGDRHFQFSSDLYSELRGVQFDGGVISPFIDGAPVDENTAGFSSAEDRSENSPTKHLHCESDPERHSPWGRASLDATGLDRRTIALRVTDRLEYEGNCDDGRSPGYGITAIDGATPDYDGPFDQVFELPLEAIGQGKIIQRVSSQPVDRDTCPGYDESTTVCVFSWEAEVTFVRADYGELPAPLVTPAPALPPTPGPEATDSMVKHVTDAIRDYLEEQRIAESIAKAFRDSHKSVSVQLDCPGPCSGTVSAYAVATAKSAPSGKPLATATFRTDAGGSRLTAARADDAESVLARWRFDAADRRALAKRKFVALRFAMRTGNDPKVRRATIVVRFRK